MVFLSAQTATAAAAASAAAPVDPRLQAVLRRSAAGLPTTVAVLGGSITAGYAAQAPAESGWAAQLGAWFARRGPTKLINAGLSGTDSTMAAARLQTQVLDAQPDLVVLEFGINDLGLDPLSRGSSYEGLLRRLQSAAKPPAVLVLALTLQGGQQAEAAQLQVELARHYGLQHLDMARWLQARVGAGLDRWEALWDEPVHPNQLGHDRLAQALVATLEACERAPAQPAASWVRPPLHGLDHEFVHSWGGEALQPWRQQGFGRGGPLHPEWSKQPGGLPLGWLARGDGATASFLVWGREIALLHAQSPDFRNLEAWIDDGPAVTVQGHVPQGPGPAWRTTVVARGLEPGAHLLHLRMKRDAWVGTDRPAHLLMVVGAGLLPPPLHPSDFRFVPVPGGVGATVQGSRFVPASDPRLAWVGRTPVDAQGAHTLTWSGTEMRARFTGAALGLRLAHLGGGLSHFTVEIDGRRHRLSLPEAAKSGAVDAWIDGLTPGEHRLRLVKRSEASQAEARLLGLSLPSDGRWLSPPPKRQRRFIFYGDSITAGACNGDLGTDQYQDLSTHDGTRAYGALTAAHFEADYLGHAVSGIGITASWDDAPLMPQIYDRVAPRPDAPLAPVAMDGQPALVFVNLGQNDQGFPATHGRRFAPDYAERYLDFVRSLRRRYPQAGLVLLTGGMTAWKEQPELVRARQAAAEALRQAGDRRVWSYTFEAFSWAHPRIDVHQRMAEELIAFVQRERLL